MNAPDMVYLGIAGAQSLVFVVCTLVGMIWLFRLWRRSGETGCLWLSCALALSLFRVVVAIFLSIFVIPRLYDSGVVKFDLTAVDKIFRHLLHIAEYLCIFIALSKLSNRAVPFTEIAAPVMKRFR